ncbi:MAG: hypothetical protein RIS76_4623 [Verrucomicrobiota bacterium]
MTGPRAYSPSLAAAGAIFSQDAKVLTLHPICPHNLSTPKPLHPDGGTPTLFLTGIPFRWHALPHEIAETPCCPIIPFPSFPAVSPRHDRSSGGTRTSDAFAQDSLDTHRHTRHRQACRPQKDTHRTGRPPPHSDSACLPFIGRDFHAQQGPQAPGQDKAPPGRSPACAKDRRQDPLHRRRTTASPPAGSVPSSDSPGPRSAPSDSGGLGFVPFPA